jgi:undecaprenyl-diphosphatase
MIRDGLRRIATRLPAPLAGVVGRLAESDAVFLVRALLVVTGVWLFLVVASEVKEGETTRVDEAIMRALRHPDDPARGIGPSWMEGSMRDLTALGSSTVLVLFTVAVAVFLGVRRQFHALALVLIATGGGAALGGVLKAIFARPRPELVPHLTVVASSSFPSGHSMSSAAVYLTLGALLSRLVKERKLKVYFLAVACMLTFLVGLSRVYLGVHYPTDVLAGWSAGLAWAVLCWMVASQLQRKGTVEESK